MAGYSRQSAASIVPTAVVRATPLNDEFNTLRDAFVVATGHKHDGTSTEGAYVPLISDTNSRNKVVVDSANNRISLFINVSSAAVEQLRLIDGAILPVTDNDIDLGSSSFEFKDLFIDGTANIDSLVADTAAISGGTINSAVIGGTTPAAGTFTTITATVSATIPSVAITGGTINNTIIGATTPAAGTFTNLTVNTAATIASAAISAGTINNTVIGGTTPQAVTGTTITANTGFVGALTGNVTGNVTASSGTSTFNNATVNGTLSATLTGNVNASSGTSTFNNVTISGTLNMDGATAATITNLSSPVNNSDAATKGYVDTAISNLIDTAPGTLDTLNELAAALGDDPNFATTVTNSIATKLSLSGGTMTGAIAMGTNKITGMGDPTNAQDAATKTYVDTQRDTRLALSGGTMSGAIAMGTNKITGLGDPTSNQDAATKIYVDGILGSATSAAASAAAAATSASNAATSASNASTSATNAASSASAAAASAAAAAASYDSFDDRYLGVKTSDPSLDNDGNALVTGAIYFNSTAGEMRVWTGSAWASTLLTTGAQTFTGVKTFSSNPILDAGTANGVAYLNGSKVLTTGSALTFDGNANFSTGGSNAAGYTQINVNNTASNGYSRILFNIGAAGANGIGSIKYAPGIFFALGTDSDASSTPMTFNLNGSEQMRLTSTGLGIGTSSPGVKLDVQGSATDFVAFNGLNTNNNAGVATSSAIKFGFTSTVGTHYATLKITEDAGNDNSGGLTISLPFGGVESTKLTLSSSGNLGLGVTPSAWGSGYTAQQIKQGALWSTGTQIQIGSNAFWDGSNYKYILGDFSSRLQQVSGEFRFFTAASGTAGNTISFTQAMTLDASGNLGVGTTTPNTAGYGGAVLGIYGGSNTGGNIWLTSDTTAAGNRAGRIGFGTEGNSTNKEIARVWSLAAGSTAGNLGGDLLFSTKPDGGALTERARIDSSGNFGIGTSSPLDRLDVVSAGPNRSRIRSSGASEAVLLFQNSATGTSTSDGLYLGIVGAADAYLWNYENNPLIFGTNNTERARIPAAGGFQCVNSISVGNATPTTSGAGITFPATQSASSNANTLDDYEEGTFTLSNGGNTTYTTRSGRYTKIGNFVKCCFFHNINTIGTGSATTLTGLPFAASSTAPTINGGVVTYVSGLAVSALAIGVYADNAAQIIFMTRNANDTNATTQLPAVMGNSFAVYAEVSYLID